LLTLKVTSYRLRLGISSRQGQGFFHHDVQTRSVAHPGFYPMGNRDPYSLGQSGRNVKLTAHLHIVPRLRIGRVFISTPPYVFIAFFSGIDTVIPSRLLKT
jgi:hypothetical protein